MSVMSEYMHGLDFGEPPEHEKMTVIPVMGSADEASVYLTFGGDMAGYKRIRGFRA